MIWSEGYGKWVGNDVALTSSTRTLCKYLTHVDILMHLAIQQTFGSKVMNLRCYMTEKWIGST